MYINVGISRSVRGAVCGDSVVALVSKDHRANAAKTTIANLYSVSVEDLMKFVCGWEVGAD